MLTLSPRRAVAVPGRGGRSAGPRRERQALLRRRRWRRLGRRGSAASSALLRDAVEFMHSVAQVAGALGKVLLFLRQNLHVASARDAAMVAGTLADLAAVAQAFAKLERPNAVFATVLDRCFAFASAADRDLCYLLWAAATVRCERAAGAVAPGPAAGFVEGSLRAAAEVAAAAAARALAPAAAAQRRRFGMSGPSTGGAGAGLPCALSGPPGLTAQAAGCDRLMSEDEDIK
eukprot:Skav224399  [mRNA]  locus=scaffold2452:221954:228730:- [translate_table: standard]